MAVTTFTPKDVMLDIGGYRVTDWNMISITPDQEKFTQHKGIAGKNTRVRNKDTSAIIEIEVIQSGKANEIFSRVLALDDIYGTARLELTCKYLNGGSAFFTTTAYLTGEPSLVYDNNLNGRVWTIVCDDVSDMPTQGISSLTSTLVNLASKLF